jgi:hypothetical protein
VEAYANDLVDVRLEQLEDLLDDRQAEVVLGVFEQARVELAGTEAWKRLLELERKLETDKKFI